MSLSEGFDSTFFDRTAVRIAHDLVGCRLNWKDGDQSHSRIITQTEAYTGPDDLASHASKGRRTKRNEAMFGPPGAFYVYRCYGVHWMLNVVTGPIGYPAAVLMRAVEGIVDFRIAHYGVGNSGALHLPVPGDRFGSKLSDTTQQFNIGLVYPRLRPMDRYNADYVATRNKWK